MSNFRDSNGGCGFKAKISNICMLNWWTPGRSNLICFPCKQGFSSVIGHKYVDPRNIQIFLVSSGLILFYQTKSSSCIDASDILRPFKVVIAGIQNANR